MSSEILDILEQCASQGRKILTYEESRKVMDRVGFPLNKMFFAQDVEDCIIKASEIGYPVVLKIVSKDVVHKSDSGGIKVGIKSAEELNTACCEMLKTVEEYHPNAKIDGFSVEEMVEGVELLIGTNTDKQFGKMIALGIGGIFVEVYKDVSFRLIPVTKYDVEEMIDEIVGKKLLEGYRGKPKIDQKELISFVLKVSDLIESFPQIKEMDLNPVVGTFQGLRAIDARIILE